MTSIAMTGMLAMRRAGEKENKLRHLVDGYSGLIASTYCADDRSTRVFNRATRQPNRLTTPDDVKAIPATALDIGQKRLDR